MINILQFENIRSGKWKFLIVALMLLMMTLGVLLFLFYEKVYSPNIDLGDQKTAFLYIPTGSTQEDVVKAIESCAKIKDMASLEWVMEKKNYARHIYSGRYLVENGMNNNDLIDLLRSGIQTPLELTFNNTRTLEEFAGKISRQIETDSLSLLTYLRNESNSKAYGFAPHNIIAMFIPNTYQVYWNMDAKKFVSKMHQEYAKYWTIDRLKKAESIGLSPIQVSTLASIVDEETIKNDEKPRVAGVYMNRLKSRIKLDADPTLKFAVGDFTIRRVLNKHKKIDSPYNTYKYAGLPPGPIRQPSISGIEAVLNYEQHKYYYFCASPEFNGYHVFARSLREHNQNADRYQKALNQRGIMK